MKDSEQMGLPCSSIEIQFRERVITELTELKTLIVRVVGNGQPGALQTLESRVVALEIERAERRGRATMFSAAAFIVGGALDALLRKFIH